MTSHPERRAEPDPTGEPINEAVVFVQNHRDLFTAYARGEVTILPASPESDTFAFDLVANRIYISPRFYRHRGLSQTRTTFATLHEIEHFLEKVRLVSETDGASTFQRYLDRIEASRAYALTDNCVADIRQNRAVITKTNPGFAELEQGLYREDLMPVTDLTKEPRHIQFCSALLREARVPGESCTVAPEVRQQLEALRSVVSTDGEPLLDVITHPDVPQSVRLAIQDERIWPIVEELLNQDLADQTQTAAAASSDGGDTGNHPTTEAEALDPNDCFGAAYDAAESRAPSAVPIEQLREALKQWQAQHGGSPLERADQAYAQQLGVEKTALQRYRQLVAQLSTVVNPETHQTIIEELRELIRRIIAERVKPAVAPKYPLEEGDYLVDPVEVVTQFHGGNLQARAWESTEIVEQRGKKFGEVEMTLVCDRSTSMEGAKLIEQQRATVLLMEALGELGRLAEEQYNNLVEPLVVRSEVYSFQSSATDSVPLKSLSDELTEKQRVDVTTALASVQGSTTDFVPLETIAASLTQEVREKIQRGELKKVIIVFTDGYSNDAHRVQTVLQTLRAQGIVVVGVGVTESAEAALTTYAPDARLAVRATDLPVVLGQLLAEHMRALNG